MNILCIQCWDIIGSKTEIITSYSSKILQLRKIWETEMDNIINYALIDV